MKQRCKREEKDVECMQKLRVWTLKNANEQGRKRGAGDPGGHAAPLRGHNASRAGRCLKRHTSVDSVNRRSQEVLKMLWGGILQEHELEAPTSDEL